MNSLPPIDAETKLDPKTYIYVGPSGPIGCMSMCTHGPIYQNANETAMRMQNYEDIIIIQQIMRKVLKIQCKNVNAAEKTRFKSDKHQTENEWVSAEKNVEPKNDDDFDVHDEMYFWSNNGIVRRKKRFRTKGLSAEQSTAPKTESAHKMIKASKYFRLITNLIGFSMFLIINKRLPVHVFIRVSLPFCWFLSLSPSLRLFHANFRPLVDWTRGTYNKRNQKF